MSSDQLPDLLDLERDIPTTPEDVRALRENRPRPDLHWLDQLQILVDQVPNAHELRWKRRTFAGWEPFEL
jgi:hypothetical protein